MIITKEIDYAIRMLRVLADKEQHSVQKMSETEDVPCHFAYKIIKKLEKANILTIYRGVNGGCRRTADLSKVSLFDVFSVMGEDRLITACVGRHHECKWNENHDHACTVHKHLCKMQAEMDNELRNSFISDLLVDINL